MVDNKLSETDVNDYSHCNSNKIINIEDPVLENTNVEKKSYKDVITFYVRYKTVRGIKPLYFVFLVVAGYVKDRDDGCIENGDDGCINIKIMDVLRTVMMI